MGGEEFKVGRMPHLFRMELYKGNEKHLNYRLTISIIEHYGADSLDEVEDPMDPDFLEKFIKRAEKNTEIYYDIFKCEPDNAQINFEKIKSDRKEIQNMDKEEFLNKYNELKDEIKGHFVIYPTEYLSKQSLSLNFTNFTKFIPDVNFV